MGFLQLVKDFFFALRNPSLLRNAVATKKQLEQVQADKDTLESELSTLKQQLPALQALHALNKDEFAKVWSMVTEVGEQERHFNTSQGTYRTLASTWLLAMFGAVGLLLQAATEPVIRAATDKVVEEATLDKWMLVSGVGLATVVGIMLLWMLDVLVYHRLLMKSFNAGLKLEDWYAWLPRLRSGGTGKGRVRKNIARFYLFLSVPGALFAMLGGLRSRPAWDEWLALGAIVAIVIIMWHLWQKQATF